MTADKTNHKYPVVSYFCGCGGLDLGFRGGFRYHNEEFSELPFDIKVAYDVEPRCVKTYNDYFGEGKAEAKDITTLDVGSVPPADILIGGFPCQEFSSCGPLGGLDSDRGKLYQTLITYMTTHHPYVVVGENVINLERMEKGAVLEKIKEDLTAARVCRPSMEIVCS